MPTRFCLPTTQRIITLLGLASLGMAITLPATAQMVVNSRELNQLTDRNSQSQPRLKATPGFSLVAQSSVRTIADELDAANASFSTLNAALKAAGLTPALASRGPFTIFAPVNEAFTALPSGTVPTLLKPANRTQLTKILTYHIVPGNIRTYGLRPGSTTRLRTLAGQTLTVQVNDAGKMFVNKVPVVMADIPAKNGTIHGITGVLLP